MNTPICDFVAEYARKDSARFHMPGHKGVNVLGCELLDITEIPGADSLYEADGIIRESEGNAGRLFGARTFYSAEGSSLAIRAMLHLVCQRGTPLVWAGRNAHSAFLTAAALLGIEVEWLYSSDSYLSCIADPAELDAKLQAAAQRPAAVYVTSPDYLGNQNDIRALAQVCHKHGVLLLVDNAHGAYLKFLPESLHPMDLGADICCDSAHKTLPVLTGGAYLHLSERMRNIPDSAAKDALRLFGSTSPSYLILQSLDRANAALAEEYPRQLWELVPAVQAMKQRLQSHGYCLVGTEPMKLTIFAKPYGYTGTELAALLEQENIVVEFADPDYVVFMLSPSLTDGQMARLERALLALPPKAPILDAAPKVIHPERRLLIRQAMLSPAQRLPIEQCLGRVLAQATVGCPPAVPILTSGEIIDEAAIECFRYYGIDSCNVVREM